MTHVTRGPRVTNNALGQTGGFSAPHFTEISKSDYSLSMRTLFIIPLVLMSLVSFPIAGLAEKVLFSKAPNGRLVYLDTESIDKNSALLIFDSPNPDYKSASASATFVIKCQPPSYWMSGMAFYELPMGEGKLVHQGEQLTTFIDVQVRKHPNFVQSLLYKKFCIDDEKKKILERNLNRVYNEATQQKHPNLPISKPKKGTKEQKEALEKLLKSLASAASKAAASEAVAPKAATLPEKPTVSRSDVDRLRQHVASCWSPPVIDAKIWDRAVVDVMVEVDRSGAVLAAEIADKKRLINDSQFQIFAESAVDALWQCSPLPLPPDNYDLWKSFMFSFDASFLKH